MDPTVALNCPFTQGHCSSQAANSADFSPLGPVNFSSGPDHGSARGTPYWVIALTLVFLLPYEFVNSPFVNELFLNYYPRLKAKFFSYWDPDEYTKLRCRVLTLIVVQSLNHV